MDQPRVRSCAGRGRRRAADITATTSRPRTTAARATMDLRTKSPSAGTRVGDREAGMTVAGSQARRRAVPFSRAAVIPRPTFSARSVPRATRRRTPRGWIRAGRSARMPIRRRSSSSSSSSITRGPLEACWIRVSTMTRNSMRNRRRAWIGCDACASGAGYASVCCPYEGSSHQGDAQLISLPRLTHALANASISLLCACGSPQRCLLVRSPVGILLPDTCTFLLSLMLHHVARCLARVPDDQ